MGAFIARPALVFLFHKKLSLLVESQRRFLRKGRQLFL